MSMGERRRRLRQSGASFEDGGHEFIEHLEHRGAGLRGAPVGGFGHAPELSSEVGPATKPLESASVGCVSVGHESHLQNCDGGLNFLCCEAQKWLRAPPDGLEDQGIELRP